MHSHSSEHCRSAYIDDVFSPLCVNQGVIVLGTPIARFHPTSSGDCLDVLAVRHLYRPVRHKLKETSNRYSRMRSPSKQLKAGKCGIAQLEERFTELLSFKARSSATGGQIPHGVRNRTSECEYEQAAQLTPNADIDKSCLINFRAIPKQWHGSCQRLISSICFPVPKSYKNITL